MPEPESAGSEIRRRAPPEHRARRTASDDGRLADHLARMLKGMIVLKSCTAGGFNAVSAARYARRVFTAEIEKPRMEDAGRNPVIAGFRGKITFLNMDVMSPGLLAAIPDRDAAFLDPHRAVTGEDHVYRFINSDTGPPSDRLLEEVILITTSVTLVRRPCIGQEEFDGLPPHECKRQYLNGSFELPCLHFGRPARSIGNSEFRA